MTVLAKLKKNQRPREKLLALGAENLTDPELLAIFLRTGIPGKNAIELSEELLKVFGGLSQIIHASNADLNTVKGIGNAKYAQLQASLEMAKRCLRGDMISKRIRFTQTAVVREYVQHELGQQSEEVFAAIFLDNQHQLLVFEKLFYGTINSAPVFPRRIVRRALEVNAAAVILAHNHPSGVLTPSQSDKLITIDLKQALKIVDIRVIDHIIVGPCGSMSMVEEGVMP